MHRVEDIIAIFNDTFFASFNTKLVKGENEPIYLPANGDVEHHRIIFAHGYYASALHEIAHWCVAGAERRLLEDFGYWYEPDGRTAEQQALFEKVEIKPQAIEWGLCVAADKKFRVSADNLNGAEPDYERFQSSVFEQVKIYLSVGFPSRAVKLMEALSAFYQTKTPMTEQDFIRVAK
ncbi:elongation factor P hydroxylase [Thalassotalea sp. M1531]|uniref:Elongation factor P hydroxylase n=1 Tax=Thalassotalea algicola TaxID=2716224 RepID=A0A7Y0LB15_9GAMM|nr:elongation factor P hydroxylase [Thalassotalea algicola]NMP31245.1 elongation factor P hydroxylase [Thalassotalea algicola]